MDVFVRGERPNTQDWIRARQAPLTALPLLDEEQKAEAQLMRRSEEDYARGAYAGQLSQQRLLQRTLRFGRWLNKKAGERDPCAGIESVTLDTLLGKFEICAQTGSEGFEFEMDEDLVNRFLAAGSADAEKSINRILDVFLPEERMARAS
jgi:hypothetical protein